MKRQFVRLFPTPGYLAAGLALVLGWSGGAVIADACTRAVSIQYLLDADEYNYLLTHYHFTDDTQLLTASAGASYKWDETLVTADMSLGLSSVG